MRVNLFAPLLTILVFAMITKASFLFGRVQEQTIYASNTKSNSVLVSSAYASTPDAQPVVDPVMSESNKENTGNKTPSSEMTSKEHVIKPKSKRQDKLDNFIIQDDVKTNTEGSLLTNNFSKSELNLLKELAKRRDKLDLEKKQIQSREQVLKATENKIDQKVEELKKLQATLEALMQTYDKKEHSKILSLVKIYEAMKPKDAAKIFDELDMGVLLKVVTNMKEVKVAPIIASMNSVKARDLSLELAKQKPIN